MSSSVDDSRIIVTSAFYKYSNDERMAEIMNAGGTKKPDTVELVVFQSNIVGTIKNSAMEPFEFLYPYGSHSQAITNAAVTPTKSFVATISRDLTFKLWQYNGDHKQLMSFVPNSYNSESSKHDLAMDLHPLSVQVAIGLKECLRVYYLVEGDLNHAKNFQYGSCYAVSYSSRGQYLAAGFSNFVLIIDPYSFAVIREVKASIDGVKTLEWTGRDRYLVNLGNSSHFNVTDSWNNFSVKVEESKVGGKPLGKLTALTFDPEFDLLVCCCPDMVLRIYNCQKDEFYAECDNSSSGLLFTSVLLVKKLGVIFFGTQTGMVKVYLWPFSDQKKQSFDSTQCIIHAGPITSIRITPSLEHLITSSVDGTLFFLKIKERVRGNDVGTNDALGALTDQKDPELAHRISSAYSLNEFTYMSTHKQKEMFKKMTELENALMTKITEIDNDNENLTNKFNEEIKEREKLNQEELKRMNITLAAKMDDEGTKQKSLELECKEARRALKETVREKEVRHRQLLLDLYAERDEIENQMKEFEEQQNEELVEINNKYKAIIDKMKAEYEKNKQQINTQYGQAIFYLKEDQKKFQEALRQTESEYNTLIEQTETKLSEDLNQKKKDTEALRTRNTKLIKDSQKYQERIDNLDKLIGETQAQNNQLRQDIQSFQNKYNEMDDRLNQQENIINQKEGKIKEYRNKNFHLQNFKSVYDYQVTTLKEEHEPLTEYADNLNVKPS